MSSNPEVIHICDNCNYSTNKTEEWYEHLAKIAHKEFGSTICKDCGENTPMPDYPIKYGYDKKRKPNLVPEIKCKKCTKAEFEKLKKLDEDGNL